MAGSVGGPLSTAVWPATGAGAGAAAAGFFGVAALVACVAAKEIELGANAVVAIAKTIGRREEVLRCMGVREAKPELWPI
ncbi:hypothetical protein [Variovorax sp. dw_954]|uniref:hypothetical protein n=1 Tax=Variovorax sp. dw_954 TaxID=2720078 RepID=UPI0023DE8CAA|nr:hypothetical protein [Variovorax sp. dw_954]